MSATKSTLSLSDKVLQRAIAQHLGKPPPPDELAESRHRVARLRAELRQAESYLRELESRL